MDAMGNNVDAIDLTLSSSPEPEPRPSQYRRPQVQHHFKREARPYNMGSKKSQVGHPGSAGRSGIAQQHTHAVNPQHLRQIVYTSDEHALRKVLLHLCQISPALSGAVARGLAPHSTFARQVVNRRRNAAAATLKFEEDDSENSAYERTKDRLAPVLTSAKSTPRPLNTPNQYAPVRRESQVASSRYSEPRVKMESRPKPGPFGPDTDEIHLPGAYPRNVTRVASTSNSVLSTPKTPTNVNRTPFTSLPSARLPYSQREVPKRMTCVNCRMSFTADSDDVCMFHTGQKVRRDGQGVYSCCDAPFSDAGCQFGCHTSTEETQQEGNDRKRPSASPHPPGAERKRARKL